MEIIPSILSADPDEAHGLLTLCENVVSRAHIDIIDSRFADNKTVYPESFSDEIYSLNLDFHLMVEEPIRWVKRCIQANAERIIGQVELMEDQRAFFDAVTKEGALCGLALDLPTGVEALDETLLESLDLIVVMSVNAGFGGQQFDENALEKIKTLELLREEKGYHFKIADDGGVTLENEERIHKSGADEIIVGRRIFHPNFEENIQTWKRVISRNEPPVVQ